MKQPAFFLLLALVLTMILPSCQVNKWEDWKLKNELWMANNKTQPGVITTASGLQYKVIHQGYMRNPNSTSSIEVNYTGALIDGSVFDSGTKSWFSLASAIKGWQEGIPKMNGGGTYIFYIPASLGYDTITTNLKIPPHSTLIFQVDLVDSYN